MSVITSIAPLSSFRRADVHVCIPQGKILVELTFSSKQVKKISHPFLSTFLSSTEEFLTRNVSSLACTVVIILRIQS